MTDHDDTPSEPTIQLGRRQLLVTGGATISLGALLAACGGSSAEGDHEEAVPGPVPSVMPRG